MTNLENNYKALDITFRTEMYDLTWIGDINIFDEALEALCSGSANVKEADPEDLGIVEFPAFGIDKHLVYARVRMLVDEDEGTWEAPYNACKSCKAADAIQDCFDAVVGSPYSEKHNTELALFSSLLYSDSNIELLLEFMNEVINPDTLMHAAEVFKDSAISSLVLIDKCDVKHVYELAKEAIEKDNKLKSGWTKCGECVALVGMINNRTNFGVCGVPCTVLGDAIDELDAWSELFYDLGFTYFEECDWWDEFFLS